jgi:type VI secretion system protein ImpJ
MVLNADYGRRTNNPPWRRSPALMNYRPVFWHEGMFLVPQHLQAAQRHGLDFAQLSDRWNLHYSWGLRSCVLDDQALGDYRFRVDRLRARLRDGTLVDIPADGKLPEYDLKPAFQPAAGAPPEHLLVYLAVPAFDLTKANVSSNGAEEKARYVRARQELADETTGQDRKAVELLRPNFRLLLESDADHAGYEKLPIARVKKGSRPEATPELDTEYIPPLLACDAWEALSGGILRPITDRIGSRLEEESKAFIDRKVDLESQAPGDRLLLANLRALNEAYAILRVLFFAEGVHPLWAYVELCRLIGQLAVFSEKLGRRTPRDLPAYDHDNLGFCFHTLKKLLDDLLKRVEYLYFKKDFRRNRELMEVELESSWVEVTHEMYVGVVTSLNPDQCVRLLCAPGGLDMKIASAGQVAHVAKGGFRGLSFEHKAQPPRVLPGGPVYFQINTRSEPALYQDVKDNRSLALWMNPDYAVKDPENQPNELTIRTANQRVSLKFTLYVIPPKK